MKEEIRKRKEEAKDRGEEPLAPPVVDENTSAFVDIQGHKMFCTGEHSCKERRISFFQPHLRPIVRSKASANVEFCAKIGKDNRAVVKDLEIRNYCKPLGRPPKEPSSYEKQNLIAKAVEQRDEIKYSFGTGKRVYQANDIRTKLPKPQNAGLGCATLRRMR